MMTESSLAISADDRLVTPRGIFSIGTSLPGNGATVTAPGAGATA